MSCLLDSTGKITDILEVYLSQTAEEMQDLYKHVKEEGEDILQEASL